MPLLDVKKELKVLGDGRFAVTHSLDHAALKRENAFIRSHNGDGIQRKKGNIQGGSLSRPIANLDPVTFMKLEAMGILNDPAAFKRWLNDPDNADFKIVEGKA